MYSPSHTTNPQPMNRPLYSLLCDNKLLSHPCEASRASETEADRIRERVSEELGQRKKDEEEERIRKRRTSSLWANVCDCRRFANTQQASLEPREGPKKRRAATQRSAPNEAWMKGSVRRPLCKTMTAEVTQRVTQCRRECVC